MSTRRRWPASSADFSRAGRASRGTFSHAFRVTTVAPTRGAHLRSSMCGARANHCDESAASGVVSKALISPVCRRSEEHTSELQSRLHLVCRLLLEKKKKNLRQLSKSRFFQSMNTHCVLLLSLTTNTLF